MMWGILVNKFVAEDVLDGKDFMKLEDLDLDEDSLYMKFEKKKKRKKGNNLVGISIRNR